MKTLILMLTTLFAFNSFAGSSTYKCEDTDRERDVYIKVGKSFWTGAKYFKWSWDNSTFDDYENDKIKIERTFEYDGLTCVKKSSNLIIFSSSSTYCFEKQLLEQGEHGELIYASKSGNLIETTSRFNYRFSCVKI